MAVKWVQAIAMWIRTRNLPGWLNSFLDYILCKILIPAFKIVGEDMLNLVKSKVFEAAKHNDWSGEQKFKYVFDECRGVFAIEVLSNRLLNLIIELVVNQLKEQRIIL